jgi:hypothetical protein
VAHTPAGTSVKDVVHFAQVKTMYSHENKHKNMAEFWVHVPKYPNIFILFVTSEVFLSSVRITCGTQM